MKAERKEDKHDFFIAAMEAATNKDPLLYLKGLYQSGFLVGAKRTLERTWRLDPSSSDDILTTATQKMYEILSSGRRILYPARYLYKVILTTATDHYRSSKKDLHFDDSIGYNLKPPFIDELKDEEVVDEEALTIDPDELKRQGIEVARSLLPRIGKETVQAVMSYIIDAIEAGVEDIPSREIGEALGLLESSVRKWRQRGFDRLKREAIKDGYHKKLVGQIESDLPYDDDENEDEK